MTRAFLPLLALLAPTATLAEQLPPGANPIIRDRFTADPAPLVIGERLWLYTGHDEAADGEMFTMKEWLAYSTTDLRTWTFHGPIMRVGDFAWAMKDAWAAQVIAKHGRFWLYAAVEHDATRPGKAIGVAVADRPEGPFVDAKGAALITNDMTPKGTHSWEDIDPTVFTDDDGTTWIAWGNRHCYIARLGADMISIDGPITEITPPHFEEGPWLHKRGDLYYLTYASLDRSRHRPDRARAALPSIPGSRNIAGAGIFSCTMPRSPSARARARWGVGR
jgi:arabinoxylan arabinofuranohydrolase